MSEKLTIAEFAKNSIDYNQKHIQMLLDCLVEERNQSERQKLADSIKFWMESSEFWRGKLSN